MESAKKNEELVKEIQQGINRSDNLLLLFENNKKFIKRLLYKSYIDREHMEDVMQDAYICMETAADKFDTTTGLKFSTFLAGYMKGVIADYRYKQTMAVKVPAQLRSLYFTIRRAERELTMQFERTPSLEELSKFLDTPAERIKEAVIASGEVASLQQKVLSDDEDLLLQDTVSDESSIEELSIIESSDIPKILDNAIRKLPSLMDTSIRMRFYEELTIKEIAAKLNLTPGQASAYIDKGIKELRKDKTIQALKNNY